LILLLILLQIFLTFLLTAQVITNKQASYDCLVEHVFKTRVPKLIIIIIIITPLTIVKEDDWGDLECLHKAYQAAWMEAYSQTLALMNDVKMNDRLKITVR